jgi:hypothetical protein
MRKSEVKSSNDKPVLSPRHAGGQQAEFNVDPDQRQKMISESAYYRAEHRSFYGGDPVQDWLVAESEIDVFLRNRSSATPEEDAAYVHLREEVRKALSQVQDVINAAVLKKAFERGLAEAKQLESHSADTLHRAASVLRKDMALAAERMGPTWEHFSERSADLFSVWKDRSREFLTRSADAVRDWLQHEHQGPRH